MSGKKSIVHTSSNELTHSMAHYLLTIHKLREVKGYARVTDIAKELGLTKGSVSTALGNLKKRGLVLEDESKFLSLSETGHDEVHHMLSARTLVYYFIKDILGISDEVAHKDSCLVEHLLSSETRKGLFHFMQDVAKKSKLALSTDLKIDKFDDHSDFLEAQKGDKYL